VIRFGPTSGAQKSSPRIEARERPKFGEESRSRNDPLVLDFNETVYTPFYVLALGNQALEWRRARDRSLARRVGREMIPSRSISHETLYTPFYVLALRNQALEWRRARDRSLARRVGRETTPSRSISHETLYTPFYVLALRNQALEWRRARDRSLARIDGRETIPSRSIHITLDTPLYV